MSWRNTRVESRSFASDVYCLRLALYETINNTAPVCNVLVLDGRLNAVSEEGAAPRIIALAIDFDSVIAHVVVTLLCLFTRTL